MVAMVSGDTIDLFRYYSCSRILYHGAYQMITTPVPAIRCEWSYLAGLIDGEGYVGFNNNRDGSYFRVSIQMTDKDTIDWLHENFGGYKYFRPYKSKNPKHNNQWYWVLHGIQALELYAKVNPFLRIKNNLDDGMLERHYHTKSTTDATTDS
jgi:hypothetical protein